ncbi:MAG TPA: SpoIIE family protein phosphatase, partial [Gammaproteobacteria bacterium]|nr:SpoIIE family protein phosphatase [Gammaproteobacteria bacterium]
QAAMGEGHSTVGTLGRGLGSIQRLADRAELFTLPQAEGGPWHGLAVWARFHPEPPPDPAGRAHAETGLYLRAYQDRPANGDCLCLSGTDAGRLRWLHLDGLGHGEQAAESVSGVADLVDGDDDVPTVMGLLGRRLRGTRGAVAALGEVDPTTRRATLVGVGDIAAYLMDGRGRQHFPFPPGVLGKTRDSKPGQEVGLELPPGSTLVTASDGIRGRWEPGWFPGLFRLHPQMIALFLGHVLGRANDDRSLLAVRVLGGRA